MGAASQVATTSRRDLSRRRVIRHKEEYCKIDSEIGCKFLELFFEPAFAVIEIFAGTLIDPQQVGKADGFSDELYGNNPVRKDPPNISGVPKGHPYWIDPYAAQALVKWKALFAEQVMIHGKGIGKEREIARRHYA